MHTKFVNQHSYLILQSTLSGAQKFTRQARAPLNPLILGLEVEKYPDKMEMD